MVSLKDDRLIQFTISSGDGFQFLMVAGGNKCLKVPCGAHGWFE